MVRVVMLSAPGAGKGTHGRWLTQQTGAAHISSGDLLRAEVARASDLGRQVAGYTTRGDLVPDALIFSVLIPAVVAAARETGGYVLDGFPRTMPQALRAAEIAVELGLNYPKGPLALGDMLGPARVLAVLDGMQAVTHDPKYRATTWLRRRAKLGVSLKTPD